MFIENKEAWYALFVNANSEEKVKKILEKEIGDDYSIIIPKRKLRERKGGKWHFVKRKLFPGYVLLRGTLSLEDYYYLKTVPGILKPLKSEDKVLTIDENELEALRILIDKKENIIGISTVYKENDVIKIIDGPLTGFEGKIVSVNGRKGRAKVRLDFLNEERIVELGVELVDKI
ncbi:antiterminator LoaP [Herbivorax sp. ANBcel31]|uniref:antiterminator LoaP n=1 Tax=Herbivorax sp. ANBcel31 TaxID=3069754 RepID=UPI0027AF588D|nr:antiterminator LoaP [Herbivorax sp. ANBcel31]MDQ2085667.1 antiterminator LoaP [Herbivorax sp. ANBcel31]